MNWEEYEKKCDEIRKENSRYLDTFLEDIKGLSRKTIRNHLKNVDFYINDYLLREEVFSMEEGVTYIDSYLGNYFIRKCMWSTPETIKSTAASIKKFYRSMMNHGFIEKESYDYLCFAIKEDMDIWQEDCAAYNDPDADNPFDIW